MSSDIEQRIALVRDDREHGSRWLVRQTILILRDLASAKMASPDEQMRKLRQSGRALARARPAMAALASAVGRILGTHGDPDAIAQAADQLLQDYDTAIERIAEHARPYLSGRLLTCSLSGTILEVLKANRQQIEQLNVLEGRPRYEGREMAREFAAAGFPVTLLTDAQADIFIPRCHAVVVGADSVLANGDVLNKAGTALLAWSARGHNIPFYVLCETLKISPQDWPREDLHQQEALLEEKEAQEVLEQPLPGVTARNFYFDHTPHSLVDKVITERGVLNTSEISTIALSAKENARKLARE
jgi:ribose 1,5-bisphosphate isomerase